jgi:hypothetical protein
VRSTPGGSSTASPSICTMDEYVYEALRAGASGYLLKDVPPEQLVEGIRAVGSGEALLAPSITRRVIRGVRPSSAGLRPDSAGRARGADRAGAGGPAAGWPRPIERRDRKGALRQRDDGQDPRESHPHEARAERSGPGGRVRLRVGRRLGDQARVAHSPLVVGHGAPEERLEHGSRRRSLDSGD